MFYVGLACMAVVLVELVLLLRDDSSKLQPTTKPPKPRTPPVPPHSTGSTVKEAKEMNFVEKIHAAENRIRQVVVEEARSIEKENGVLVSEVDVPVIDVSTHVERMSTIGRVKIRFIVP